MQLLLGMIWLLHFLPLPILGRLGEMIGNLLYWILPRRRHITLTNLRLCFPELPEVERKKIAHQHFRSYARSVLERGILWWGSKERVKKLIRIESSAPLTLLTSGPVILLCPHFVSLDAAGIGLVLQIPICSIYAPQKNAVFDQALKNGRNRFGLVRLLSRSEGIKPIIRAMREGYGFLMLPDMDFGIKDAEFVPFFGIPAATLTAPARITAATRAKVMPVIATTLPNYQGWHIAVHPAWENYPGDDIIAATQFMNSFLEQQIRKTPAEYFWSHRRFKTRPKGEADFYKR
jgi:KDO2-lipid IV(A) lauroyltransferase